MCHLAQYPFLGHRPFPFETCGLGGDGSSLLQPYPGGEACFQVWPIRSMSIALGIGTAASEAVRLSARNLNIK